MSRLDHLILANLAYAIYNVAVGHEIRAVLFAVMWAVLCSIKER